MVQACILCYSFPALLSIINRKIGSGEGACGRGGSFEACGRGLKLAEELVELMVVWGEVEELVGGDKVHSC
ncbi:hypothetical protein QVD17_27335 [Tagetes erecta]|uniref:Uncharacterized protein n=1 Tax=Tagetes erecta TaxID=13708 RepID=A0AAD8K8I1_TARER|nr:hypothetical protein QVD17_27335 [Tagetes erecta]